MVKKAVRERFGEYGVLVVSDMAGLPSWEAQRLYMVCDDEVPDEHYVVSHLLTPLTLAVC